MIEGMGSSAGKASAVVFVLLVVQCPCLGFALNGEGRVLMRFRERIEVDPFGYLLDWGEKEGEIDPCAWNGVACEDGMVVSLNLESLCLTGSLPPELGKLLHLKCLVLHNNSFYGNIPGEIGQLQNLVVLDLGFNNFSGSFPLDIGNLLFLESLVIDGNNFLQSQNETEALGLKVSGGSHANDDGLLSTGRNCFSRKKENAIRRLLVRQTTPKENNKEPHNRNPNPSPSPRSNKTKAPIYGLIGGIAGLLILSFAVFFLFHVRKVLVRPWASSLSGQLQKALVTGLPKLKRSELETACEDFSNIVDSSSDGTVCKGTLSNGVEIAVSVIKTDGWPQQSQAQFTKKITTLSKVNHRNFVNLIGYCEDEEPLSRMLVFEYAPNGKLFEHLHNMETREFLNWDARMRIAMGVAYCLDHMLRLSPPIILKKLDSSSVHLTDNFAAKIADLELWSKTEEFEMSGSGLLHGPENVVHIFGMFLLELISARPPYSDKNGDLIFWATDYLNGTRSAKEVIDPTLSSVREEVMEAVLKVMKLCLNTDPTQRPSMEAVVEMLKGITSITPEGAAPRLSPLWWAELEIISRDAA